jgi:hypothetical protein
VKASNSVEDSLLPVFGHLPSLILSPSLHFNRRLTYTRKGPSISFLVGPTFGWLWCVGDQVITDLQLCTVMNQFLIANFLGLLKMQLVLSFGCKMRAKILPTSGLRMLGCEEGYCGEVRGR